MKKFLSIFIAVAMVLSFAGMFTMAPANAPVAKASPDTNNITLTTNDFQTLYLYSKLDTCTTPETPKTDPNWWMNQFSYFYPVPNFGFVGTPNQVNNCKNGTVGMKREVYKMGDTIYGVVKKGVLHSTTNGHWSVVLAKYDSMVTPPYTVVDVATQAYGTTSFSIGTGNVDRDGTYYLFVFDGGNYSTGDPVDPTTAVATETVIIEYNITWKENKISSCKGRQTVSGWITRGNGQTVLVPVDVYITYANDTLAGHYTITPSSSGQFSITFPIDPDSNEAKYIGKYKVFIQDKYNGYDGGTYDTLDTKDAIIYYYLDNTPEVSLTLNTYISPTRIYKNQDEQPVLLYVVDQYGNYVSGLTLANFDVEHATVEPGGFDEISKGFYKFTIDVGNEVDVRFRVVDYDPHGVYPPGEGVKSNQVIINTVELGVFNPYVDIKTPSSLTQEGEPETYDLDVVQKVYDKLPCTIGNSLWITVNSWDVPDGMKPNWYVHESYWGFNNTDSIWFLGDSDEPYYYNPYFDLGKWEHILITKAGSISVSIHMTVWERTNTDNCSTKWYENGEYIPESEMSINACCHEYSKTFDICKVKSCTYGGVTLTGDNVTDSTTVEVGKNVDRLSLSIDPAGKPDDLTCSCPNYVVTMYMVDGTGKLVKDAFTLKTYAGTDVSGSMIWYNPQDAEGPNFDDQPVLHFKKTGLYDETENPVNGDNNNPNPGLKFGDCPFTLDDITFNYPTGTSCHYRLVVKVFGLERIFDACHNMEVHYPMIAEEFNPITVTPKTTELSSEFTINEGGVDPDSILAGTLPIIDIEDPGFSVRTDPNHWCDIRWYYLFNGHSTHNISVSPTDTGYRFAFTKALSDEGELDIIGYSYNKDAAGNCLCTEKQTVKIKINVVKPEFTVQIGLTDGSTIDNDEGIITEGIPEKIYVTPTDPRGIHDFSTDSNWTLKAGTYVRYLGGFLGDDNYGLNENEAFGNLNDCDLPTSFVCFSTPTGCTQPSPIAVTGFANPNTDDDPTFDVYFVENGAYIDVTTFKLVPPTVKVDPEEVPFTIPATGTHVTFTVTDAHGHGAPGVTVTLGTSGFSSGAAGYGWSATAGITGTDGEVDWSFVPPYSGMYVVGTFFDSDCDIPCGWSTPNGLAIIEAKYKAPEKDTEAPELTVTAPEDGATVDTDTVKVEGTVTDNVGVTELYVGSQKVSFAPDGSFSATVELVEGENTIKVFAFDAAGNKAEKDLTVTYAPVKKTVVTVQIGSDVMTVNGQVEQLDVAPVIHNGHTYLPLRAIAEALGAKVDWIAATKGITLTLGKNTVGLQIGNVSAVVNGNVVAIFPPYLQPYGDGTYAATMVPLRVIAEGLGAEVAWDPTTRVVTITLVQQP